MKYQDELPDPVSAFIPLSSAFNEMVGAAAVAAKSIEDFVVALKPIGEIILEGWRDEDMWPAYLAYLDATQTPAQKRRWCKRYVRNEIAFHRAMSS